MTIRATPNLPSRDFDATEAFYARLGFERRYRDAGWMILSRGAAVVEFFPHPRLAAGQSWFSACLRAPEIEPLFAEWSDLGLSRNPRDIPRLTGIERVGRDGPRLFALVDPDGSLWRVIEDME